MKLEHLGKTFHRIVTTHDAQGRAIVQSRDALTPKPIPSGDADFALIWSDPKIPVNNDGDGAPPTESRLSISGGTVIRIVDMLPGKASPMHRSNSIDYGIVMSGELELELDGGEAVRLLPGDVVVQRGTNHLWRNPGKDTVCRIVFILTEAKPVSIGGKALDEIHPEDIG
jgi:quercetin dioxygenase-like cupin family protein